MPEYEIHLANGKKLVLEGDQEPTDQDVEDAAQSAGVRTLLMANGTGETAGQSARKQQYERPGEYLREMVSNAPGSLYDNAVGAGEAVINGLTTLGRATGEAGQNIGGVAREFVGLDPHYTEGTPERDKIVDFAKGIVPATVKHYGEYLDPDKRALKVRDDPFGVVADMAGVVGGGRPVVNAARQAPARVIDTAIGAGKMVASGGNPVSLVKGITGHGPVNTASKLFKGAPEPAVVKPQFESAPGFESKPPPVEPPPAVVAAAPEPVTPPTVTTTPKAEPVPAVVATDIQGSRSKAARGPEGRLSPTDRQVFAENIRKGMSDEDATANMLSQRAERAKVKYAEAQAAAAAKKKQP